MFDSDKNLLCRLNRIERNINYIQLTIYELVVLNSMNCKVYRYQSEDREGVENKLEELKDDSGEKY